MAVLAVSKLYADREVIKQGSYYTAHVSAMTAEGLHSKSDIAAELAHRDIVIAKLKQAIGTISYKAENIGSSEWEEAVWTIRGIAMKALNE